MGKKSKNKGYRGEHNLVGILRKHKIDARRIPLSGATEFARGDLLIEGMTAEVKLRRKGFKEIYKYLEGRDLLFIKADRKEYLCIMQIERFINLLKGGVEHDEKHSR